MELILQYVLPSILGDFISGIDKNHMKTNFLSGKVSLQGVSLNPAIVQNMNLPLKIVYSNIGQLEMKIPWLQRMKQPMELYLEDLLVIMEQDGTIGDFNIVEERVKFLDSLLKECKNKLKSLNKDLQKEESSMDYYKVLILDNLQVTIKNIHIRVENPQKGYSFGFTLDQVNMNTINEKGQPEFLDRTLEENKMRDLHKKLLVQDISVYWKAVEDPSYFIGSLPLPAEQKKQFLKGRILRNGQPHPDYQPILSLSLESYLTLKNINKENKEKEARYKLEVELKPIHITLDNNQANQMISFVNFLNYIERERKKKHKLPQLTEDEYRSEANLYQKVLAAFLENSNTEGPELNWAQEFEKSNQRDLVIELKRLLAILPNEIIASKSRSVMLKYQKKQVLGNIEKKMNKKGIFGFKTDSELRKDNEDLLKIEGFFDSFIAEEDIDRIGMNFTKGFVFQAKLKLPEASVFLIDAKSQTQQGILLSFTNTRLNFQFHNSNDYDLSTIEFLLNDVKLSLQKGLSLHSNRKEINLVTRFDPTDKQDFATLICAVKNYSDGRCAIDICGQFKGMEFYFIPEFVTCVKKFVTFEKGQDENNFVDLAYEKMADAAKNAQDQLKSMINEYSSTVTVAVNWAASHVIVPLNPSVGRESDSWILAIEGFKLYTNSENSEQSQTQGVYDSLKLEMNKINMIYVDKLSRFRAQMKDSKTKMNLSMTMSQSVSEVGESNIVKYLPLMEETSVVMELRVLRKSSKKKVQEEPDIAVNFSIGDISVNLNSLYYKKLLELSDCLDFSQESDLNEYLETEKTAIMRFSEGFYKVYIRENMLENSWTEYIMICSGYYLYFFKSNNDIEPSKYVFIKQAHVKQDTKTYDSPNILKIKNKFEEVFIAFEDEKNMNSLMEIVKRKNKEYAEQNLEIDLTAVLNNMNTSDLQSSAVLLDSTTLELQQQRIYQDPKSLQLKVNVLFEGLHMNLYEEFEKITDHVSLKTLSIEFFERPYDQNLRIQLANIHIADYTLNEEDPSQAIMILSSSDSEEVKSGTEPTKELIVIDIRLLQDKHPDYKANLIEKEISIAFNSLYINYVPERIYALMNFFVEPLSSGKDQQQEPESPSVSPIKPYNDSLLKDEMSGDLQYIAKKAQDEREVKFVAGNLKVNELSMVLFTQISHKKLAKVSLQNLSTDIDIDKNTSTYKGSLKNIQVFDLTNYQQNPENSDEVVPYEMVGIEKGLSVLEFEFTQRHESYMKEIKTDVENVFNLDVNSIRLNYVNEPVLRIANYFTNFILDFDFAQIYTYEQKLVQAKKKIKNPTFTSINVRLNHPKVILRSKPNSEVYFELDLDMLNIASQAFQNKDRVLVKNLPSFLDYVYAENYIITTSDVVLTKKFREGGSIWLSNPFKIDIVFERCMWYDDYILAHNIRQEDKISTIDNSYTLKGNSTPIFLKFNQEDYLDVMDAINLNLIFEDKKDALYHIEPEVRPELKYMKVSSQINIIWTFDYVAVIAMDQLTHSPLAKAVALDTTLEIILYRESDKDIIVSINKLSAHHYEQNPMSGQYIEKTLLGQMYKERETLIKDEDSVEETFNEDLIATEKRELERDVDNLIKIEYKMYANQDRDLIMSVRQLKMILNLKVLLRLKDFFLQEDETEEDKREIQLDMGYKSKNHYRGIIEKAEISIPTSIDTALILRSAIQFDFIQYDVTDILMQNHNDFQESSVMNLNLIKSEIFVFRDRTKDLKALKNLNHDDMATIQKRSIILPLSVMYKSKEYLCYEASNNKLLAQKDNLLAVDKVTMKASSTDSMVIAAAAIILEQQFDKYEKLPPFVAQSREVLLKMQLIVTPKDLPQITVINEKHKIVHDGIQMRIINDLSGVSVPLLDFSFHSSHANSALLFESFQHLLQGKNAFMISSSFYNSKVGKWEPIIEKWEFKLESEFGAAAEYNQKIDILNDNQEPLNINISDEMVKILLRTWREWNESFSQFRNPIRKQSLTSAQVSAKLHKISQDLTTQEISNVEQVSPFTIWNDTGYSLFVESHITGAKMKGVDCKDKLDMKPGDQTPLIIEMTADRIFEASTKENVLERLKISVTLIHPVYGPIAIPNIDVHNFGIKKRRIELKDINKICPIVCHVYTHKKKKYVRFSSPIIIENSLPKPLIVQIEKALTQEQEVLIIEPNTSTSIPFDHTYNSVSFSYDSIDPNKEPKFFPLEKLFSNTISSIFIGNNHALLRSQFWQTHAKIFLEPLLTVKNCLPCPIAFEIIGKRGTQEKEILNTLQPQERVQITDFSGDFQAKMRVTVDKFITNDYYILPVDNKLTQTLYLHNHREKVPLNINIIKSRNGTYNILISAKTLVVNESEESLHFLGHNETSSWISPFAIPHENGYEMVLFEDVAAMKIKPKSDKSSMSEAIPLNQLGMFTADCYDKEKQTLNIGVHVRNQLCDKKYNLFTKVISVLPRYVIVNQTSHMISFYQIECPDKPLILIPGERSSFHFSKDSKDRFIKIRINGSEDNQQWKDSGSLDVSGPGNFDFIIQNQAQTQDKYFNILTSMQDASLFINLQEQDPSDTLIQIQNNTTAGELVVNQQGIYDTKYSVLPQTTLPFAWLQPCLNNTIVFRLIDSNRHSAEFSIKLDDLTKSLTDKPAFETEYEKINYRLSLSGRSRVIEFYPAKKQKKEVKKGTGEIKLLFRVCLPSLGISLISTASQKKSELAFISLTPLMFAMVSREESSTIQLRIKSITIDNNFIRDAQYPVTLFPSDASKLQELDLPHFDFICKIRNNRKDTDILYVHDLQFYLAKTNICLDGHTVNALTDFMRNIDKGLEKDVYDGVKFSEFLFLSDKERKNLHKSYHHQHDTCITWRNLDPAVSTSDFVYFEKLAIQLLMFNITFKNPQFDFGGSYFSSYLKNALGKALANLDNVPIRLSGIDIKSMYSTKDQAIKALGEHYKTLLKASVFKLIFSANIIGNPIKLFGRISNGVNDLIDKPVQGFLEGPLQGGIGIIGGVGSLAAKTVGATFNSLHSITDSLASGLTNLSGDKDYIEKREKTNAKSNANVLTGSVQAFKSIGKGIFSGLTGVVEKPIAGAAKGGVGGLFKGIYVGAKGLAIKPVAGVLDGVSKLTEGVSNTIDKDKSLEVQRQRPPRAFYGKERIFRTYNMSHMYVVNFLINKNPKKYSELTLLEIVFLDQTKKNSYCLVLTLERVFLISMEKRAIAWKLKSEIMKESFRSENGIEIILKKPTKKIPQQLVMIPCTDSHKKTEIYTLLHALHEVVEDTLYK